MLEQQIRQVSLQSLYSQDFFFLVIKDRNSSGENYNFDMIQQLQELW